MPLETHPLEGHESWQFLQPTVGVQAKCLTRDVGDEGGPSETIHTVTHGSTCREGLIGNIRQALRSLTVTKERTGSRSWEVELVQHQEIILDDERVLGPGDTRLFTDARYLRPEDYAYEGTVPEKKYRKINLEEFIKVSDIVVGLPAVLLNPNRKAGEWWKTDIETCVSDGRIHWNGADSVVLRHPAVMAVLTGLYRQAWLLCYGGFAPQILEQGRYEDVVEVISAAEWKPAFGMAEAFRTWINVPPPKGGYPYNFAFPWHAPKPKRVSYWQRFVRLQRALRRHGYEEVLGQDIPTGWGLLDKGTKYSGAYSFWGQEKKLTEAHKRIMQLGRPLKRKKKDEEAQEPS